MRWRQVLTNAARVRQHLSDRLSRLVAVSLAALVSCVHTYGQCQYEVTSIGPPPCGIFGPPPANGQGLNNVGELVGYLRDCPDPDDVAFLWSPDGGIVELPMPNETPSSQALDVNDQGLAVGWFGVPQFGFLHDGNTAVILDGLPDLYTSEALAINEVGQIVGAWGTFGDFPRAFVWHEGVMTDLTPLFDEPNATALDINVHGDITGSVGDLSFDDRAFVLQDGTVTMLPMVQDWFTSQGRAINNAGMVAMSGKRTLPGTGEVAWRIALWDGGEPTDLGSLPGRFSCCANDIDELGRMVGYCHHPVLGFSAFLWQQDVFYDLNDFIGTSEIHISIAHAINDIGQIAGQGVQGGDGVAVLLTPIYPTGDLDGDCAVGIVDFLNLLAGWGRCADNSECAADLNGDGFVDIDDFTLLLKNWG